MQNQPTHSLNQPGLKSTRPGAALRVSAIVPALNEEASIGPVVSGLLQLQDAHGNSRILEVIVADNGSSDATAVQAKLAGAQVISVTQRGYGAACWAASEHSAGDVLLFVDGDGSADTSQAEDLLCAIEAGFDLAIGVRGEGKAVSMTWAQRFGNRLACALMRLVWCMPARDLGPFRAVRRSAMDAIQMQDRGYGWTVEMQVRAHVLGLAVVDVPVRWRNREAGVSKISGTVRGVVGAGIGIIGMIFKLWLRERKTRKNAKLDNSVVRTANSKSRCQNGTF